MTDWYTLADALAAWDRIPADDRRRIMRRPATTDRAADMAWRRLCARHGISTGPRGISADRRAYAQGRRREERIESLQAQLADAEARIRDLRLDRARARISRARHASGSDGPVSAAGGATR